MLNVKELIEAVQQQMDEGGEFTIVIMGEVLDTGGYCLHIKRAVPLRRLRTVPSLYDFARRIREEAPHLQQQLFLSLSPEAISLQELRLLPDRKGAVL